MEKFCEVDGASMKYSEGFSKTKVDNQGKPKPWAMWKCPQCQAIEWGKVATPRGNTPQIAPQGLTGEVEGLLKQILSELKQINVNTKQFPEPEDGAIEGAEDLKEFGI